jgi:hypothetical protein
MQSPDNPGRLGMDRAEGVLVGIQVSEFIAMILAGWGAAEPGRHNSYYGRP